MDYKELIADYAKQYQATRSDRAEKMRYRGKVETRKRTEGAIPWRYGISVAEYRAFKAERGCICEICGKALADNESGTEVCVDHSHRTGKVRGILCSRCNLLLGTVEKYYDKYKATGQYAAERNYLRARDEDYA